ncbi:LysR family transcriptional regulator [Rhodomicrobium vannielii ATCC 17100]|uniref:LysR family transcriptional regulator n=1 Tax=Rhodomicrobium vannielii TaxID=1069 RepID=UPI00191B5928|nr:LysR family transcriptional regulator [Rhodomicrobium vannielii]MBJ7533185.1 LysR family transcriptional regulator [Rhodomicrobium vannielii ATCC 17100]
MNWDNLRIFLAVARLGALRPTAVSLGVDQATVGRRLKALEAETGAALFRRRRDGYELTEVGGSLVAEAEAMESAAAAFSRKAASADGALAGPVRIATTDVLARSFILPALTSVRNHHPQISAVVSASICLADIAGGEADIAIRSHRPDDSDLIIRRLHRTIVGLYAAPDYVARRGRPVRGTGFAGHDLVMYGRRGMPRHWQNLCSEPITNGTVALETDSQGLLLDAIRQGLGIGPLSRDIVAFRYPDLVNVLPDCTEEVDLWLIVHPAVYATARVRVVIDAITNLFRQTGKGIDAG